MKPLSNRNPIGSLALGAGGGLALWHLLRHREDDKGTAPTSGWVFPVPSLGERHAVISDGFGSPRTLPDGTKTTHLGADLMFRRHDARDLVAAYPPGTPNGTKAYFMPDGIQALAASEGTVHYASWTTFGFTIVIRHPSGWATYYTHLASLAVAPGDIVTTGQPIGIIGGSPTDARHLKHLHLELWRNGTRTSVVDPAPYLDAWSRVVVADWTPTTIAQVQPRNAGYLYRPVGARGEPYPSWVRELEDNSGVYIIRDRNSHDVLYVGSSVSRLYATLTRHFQVWRRWKTFWTQQYARQHDPGVTYERDRVEVAVRITRADDALDEESRLIHRLRPRDNLIGNPNGDEVPF